MDPLPSLCSIQVLEPARLQYKVFTNDRFSIQPNMFSYNIVFKVIYLFSYCFGKPMFSLACRTKFDLWVMFFQSRTFSIILLSNLIQGKDTFIQNKLIAQKSNIIFIIPLSVIKCVIIEAPFWQQSKKYITPVHWWMHRLQRNFPNQMSLKLFFKCFYVNLYFNH